MSTAADAAVALEAYLARLLLEPEARARFAAAPSAEAQRAGVSEDDNRTLAGLDLEALELAAVSFAHKRQRAAASPSGARPDRSRGLLRRFRFLERWELWARWRR